MYFENTQPKAREMKMGLRLTRHDNWVDTFQIVKWIGCDWRIAVKGNRIGEGLRSEGTWHFHEIKSKFARF